MANPPLVSLTRSEPTLSTVFQEMYQDERLVDVTLSCCDGQIHAHKLILSACSSYFRNLFERLANTFHYPIVVLKDVLVEDLKLIVDFMYFGEITTTQEKLISLVKIAENLNIDGLSGSMPVTPTDNKKQSKVKSNKFRQVMKSTNPHVLRLDNQISKAGYNHELSPQFGNRRGPNLSNSVNNHDASRFLGQSMVVGDSLEATESQSFSSQQQPTSSRCFSFSSTMNPQSSLSGMPSNSRELHLQHSAIDIGKHNVSHTLSDNMRPRIHQCNICFRSFREKANLKRHQQIHAQNRCKYVCPLCSRNFSWKDNYIRHTKTAHHQSNAARAQTT